MKRRQEAAEESERQRLQAEADAKAASEAAEAERARAEAAASDQADAPGSPQSGREHESGLCTLKQSDLLIIIIHTTLNYNFKNKTRLWFVFIINS